jgi:hypothetical protein
MYQTKIGNNASPRVPNPEWSGCGFSKTYMNLFPADKPNGVGASGNSICKDSGNGSIEDNWRSSTTRSDNNSNGGTLFQSKGTAVTKSASGKDAGGQHKTHAPLGQQQSNLLDFATTRPQNDTPAKDLAGLFCENGLGRYCGKY